VLRPTQAQLARVYFRNIYLNKRVEGMVQVIDHLPGMDKALDSILNTTNENHDNV
jgi:hypothetical protein